MLELLHVRQNFHSETNGLISKKKQYSLKDINTAKLNSTEKEHRNIVFHRILLDHKAVQLNIKYIPRYITN